MPWQLGSVTWPSASAQSTHNTGAAEVAARLLPTSPAAHEAPSSTSTRTPTPLPPVGSDGALVDAGHVTLTTVIEPASVTPQPFGEHLPNWVQ